MIPEEKKVTWIKNETLTEIFAKGRLTLDEMCIAFYILRWFWGFDNGEKGQGWTRPLKEEEVAKDLRMAESNLNTVLNKMIKEKKILVKDKRYHFNEQYDSWKPKEENKDKET